jgi:hypothetical protein
MRRLSSRCDIFGSGNCEGTKIHHLSIAARDSQHVAGVLPELMGVRGKAVPFPPNPFAL